MAGPLERIWYVRNTRILCAAIAAAAPAPAEPEYGDMPPALVRAARKRMRWPPEFPPWWYQDFRGAVFEGGAPRLQQLRTIAALAGLIHCDAAGFRLSRRGAWLLAPGRADLLYRVLVRAALRNLTLIVHDPTDTEYYVQTLVPAAFDVLRRLDGRWRSLRTLTRALGFPELRARVGLDFRKHAVSDVVENVLFDVLRILGLLARKDVRRRNQRWTRSPVRPSRVFRQLVTLDAARLAERERRTPAFAPPAPKENRPRLRIVR